MSHLFPDVRRNALYLAEWALAEAPIPPPPIVKQLQIGSYFVGNKYKHFVETGTYLGWTTKAIADLDVEVDSIELAQLHYDRAVKNFEGNPKVRIHMGDSGKILPKILDHINSPAIFWLDGHFSGGDTALGDMVTPIEQELNHIKNHHIKEHIIFIDDVRLFGSDGYPPIDPTQKFAQSINSDYIARFANDSLIMALPHQHQAASSSWSLTVDKMLPPS